jgi:hypothetical protein
MLITSRDDLATIDQTIYGAAHSREVSIFGPEGYQRFAREHDLNEFDPVYGRFLIVRNRGGVVTLQTDHFGLFCTYVYRSGGEWAVSDSVNELVEHARRAGLPTTPYLPSAYALMLQRGVGQQLSSYKTPVAEITLIPHWFDVDIANGELTFKKQAPVPWTTDGHAANFDAARFFASLVKSYLDVGMTPFIRMSAGLDSRITLAGILAAKDHCDLSEFKLYTSQRADRAHERKIVLDLLDKMPMTQVEKVDNIGLSDFDDFKAYSAGLQSLITRYPAYGPPFPVFSGACGELAREFYSWGGTPDGILMHPYLDEETGSQVIVDITDALGRFDGEAKEFHSVENMHYQMFRNRFHFGRDGAESIMNYPPLVYSLLSNGSGSGDKRPIHRIFFELGGEILLRHPFDEDEKCFKGEIPEDWEVIQLGEDDIQCRKIFTKDLDGREKYTSEMTNTYREASKRYRSVHFVSDDFIDHSEAAIEAAEQKNLLSSKMITLARKDLQKLRDGRGSVTPGLFPGLMAVLAVDQSHR